jgi:putative ABC transport system permease protein
VRARTLIRTRPGPRELFTLRGHGSSILIATLSSAFGVGLTSTIAVLAQVIGTSGIQSETLQVILSFIGYIFIALALYVGAVVTSNSFSTIIAGRTRTIALMRLIGSSATAQRRAIADEGLRVGLIGAGVGTVIGLTLTAIIVSGSTYSGVIPALNYSYVSPLTFIPAVAVVFTTMGASWAGSRQVLRVMPIEATGAGAEPRMASVRQRHRWSLAAFIAGGAILIVGIIVGLTSPYGIFIALVGGLMSFTGVVSGAQAVVPRTLSLVGRLFGTDATAHLARQNAVRYPDRSSRTTISLVIGVTLVMTLAVALNSFQGIIETAQKAQPGIYAGTESALQVVIVVFSVLIGFSAIIAGLGMADNLALNVSQRHRELGLLRALGFTTRQVRRMIFLESAQLTASAVALGLALGTFYGWAGAQALIGGIQGSPGIVVPVVPTSLVVVVAVAAIALAFASSILPARRAMRISPIEALAVG